ncbi:MAG: hypothetical protein K0S07_610 [Chlamydiales bacterium]|nr:hypothetical protein [Chlamydiales bacterium]
MNAMCNALKSAFSLVPLATPAVKNKADDSYKLDSALLLKRISVVSAVVFASYLATFASLAVAPPLFFPLFAGTLAASALALPILYFDYRLAKDVEEECKMAKSLEGLRAAHGELAASNSLWAACMPRRSL